MARPDLASPWWREVDLLPHDERDHSGGGKKWVCRYCGATKRGSSTRVRAHLLGIRGMGISLCPSVPDAQLARLRVVMSPATASVGARPLDPRRMGGSHSSSGHAQSRLGEASGSTSFGRASTSMPVGGGSATGTSSIGHDVRHVQPTLRDMLHPARKARADEAVARYFFSCGIPFNTARSPYFTDMLREVASFGPTYQPPTYEALRTRLLQSEKDAVGRAMVTFREAWPKYGVSLIGDGWSDVRHRSIHGILAYCRGHSCFVRSFDTSETGKTALRLADIWTEAIQEAGPENVIQFIGDGEATNRAAGRLLQERFPHIGFTPCVAHCLNNVLRDIGRLEWVEPSVATCRAIVTFITRHHYILAVYRRLASKELLKYSDTRFAYNFSMLSRLLEMVQPLRQLVVSDEWASWDLGFGTIGLSVRNSILDDDFWGQAEYIGRVVDPIMRLMRLVDGEEPCIGKVYEGMDRMVENLRASITDPVARDQVTGMAIDRWNAYHVPLHAAAYVLDPEFQGQEQEADREVSRGWDEVLQVMVTDGAERREVRNQLSFYRQKLGMFGWDDAQADRFRVGSALWWEDYGADTPQLRRLAIRILSQGASSSPIERLWSTFGHIDSKKRNRLGVQKMTDLVYVSANLRLLHKMTGEFRAEEYIGWSHDESSTGGSEGREHTLETEDDSHTLGCDTQGDLDAADIGDDTLLGEDTIIGEDTLGPDPVDRTFETHARPDESAYRTLYRGIAAHSPRPSRPRHSQSGIAAHHGESQRSLGVQRGHSQHGVASTSRTPLRSQRGVASTSRAASHVGESQRGIAPVTATQRTSTSGRARGGPAGASTSHDPLGLWDDDVSHV